MAVRRGQDRKLLYDRDDVSPTIVVQRTYFDQTNLTITTPITPLFIVREELAKTLEETGQLPPIGVAGFSPRKALSCFANPGNSGGESNFQVILPWHPLTPALKLHLAEILAYPGVLSLAYEGEGP